MNIKAKRHFVLAFAPYGARRMASGLYTSVQGWGDYSKAKPIYIFSIGDGVAPDVADLQLGSRAWVADGFELEELTDFWPHFRDKPEFAQLVKYCEETEAKVRTVTVNSRALLAVG